MFEGITLSKTPYYHKQSPTKNKIHTSTKHRAEKFPVIRYTVITSTCKCITRLPITQELSHLKSTANESSEALERKCLTIYSSEK